jgi:CheY-like chemotaxis protein
VPRTLEPPCSVFVPLKEAAIVTSPSSEVFPASRRTTVLFVSDDEAAQLAYQVLASAGGLGVELASDAHEALLLANLLAPDLVVLDVDTAVRREVVERLRASPRTRSTPVVLITPQASEIHEGPPIAACLKKPCSSRRLLRILFLLLARRRAAAGESQVRRRVAPTTYSKRCDQCGLQTPPMHVGSNDAASAILKAAGWQSIGPGTYCPRCTTLSARSPAGARIPGVRRANRDASAVPLRLARVGGEKG